MAVEKRIDIDKEREAARLRGSFLEFTRVFFKITTGRDFIISQPPGRESHHIILARELTRVFRGQTDDQRLLINIAPGTGKSVFVSSWVAWTMTHYPDSNFLYIAYSHDLASKHTSFIKTIMSSRYYEYLFNVSLKKDSRAKDRFQTVNGGTVGAFGSSGAITGQDAGLPGLDRFSGAVIIDDAHKPDEVTSDLVRGKVIENYKETIAARARGINVPIISIGQRLHEDDLSNFLLEGNDVRNWESVIIKSLDDSGNALYPEVKPKEELLMIQEKSPYMFASQHQQDPVPAGGGIFKSEWFEIMDDYPTFLTTFITADTAETAKSYNDATVFSFWGLYDIETIGVKTGELGLDWIDCVEVRVEPKDLKDTFMDFWQECMRFHMPPMLAAIEKKSTGVTLVSVLEELRTMEIRAIERTSASGSKTQRFLELQPYIKTKRVSIHKDAKHKELVLNHMSRITANDTHRHDDIADTLADAVRIGLIDKTIYTPSMVSRDTGHIMSNMARAFQKKAAAKGIINHGNR